MRANIYARSKPKITESIWRYTGYVYHRLSNIARNSRSRRLSPIPQNGTHKDIFRICNKIRQKLQEVSLFGVTRVYRTKGTIV